MSESNRMDPMSGEIVQVDGVYENESGHPVALKRGDTFPADLILGETEWTLTEYSFDNHHEGRTDPRLVPKEDDVDKMGKIDHPRRQMDRGKK
ncbi:transposase [Cohnella cholangitidis]|uniref:Transposase n=1 Tax=Cohnella cholangitidis TaxID=2598458 RepID=A0A7G5C790_9BACL|nr:transposase [Cohnella cholangitidis]QMV45074.1 transposase [Cohnella cholangitidis]